MFAAGFGLEVLAVACDDPVVTFGAGDWGGEPDLFVGRLFVDDVCAVRSLEIENIGLKVVRER